MKHLLVPTAVLLLAVVSLAGTGRIAQDESQPQQPEITPHEALLAEILVPEPGPGVAMFDAPSLNNHSPDWSAVLRDLPAAAAKRGLNLRGLYASGSGEVNTSADILVFLDEGKRVRVVFTMMTHGEIANKYTGFLTRAEYQGFLSALQRPKFVLPVAPPSTGHYQIPNDKDGILVVDWSDGAEKVYYGVVEMKPVTRRRDRFIDVWNDLIRVMKEWQSSYSRHR